MVKRGRPSGSKDSYRRSRKNSKPARKTPKKMNDYFPTAPVPVPAAAFPAALVDPIPHIAGRSVRHTWAKKALQNGRSTPAKQAAAATIASNEKNNVGASANISTAGASQSVGTNDESAVPNDESALPNVPDQHNIQ